MYNVMLIMYTSNDIFLHLKEARITLKNNILRSFVKCITYSGTVVAEESGHKPPLLRENKKENIT